MYETKFCSSWRLPHVIYLSLKREHIRVWINDIAARRQWYKSNATLEDVSNINLVDISQKSTDFICDMLGESYFPQINRLVVVVYFSDCMINDYLFMVYV